MVGKYEIMRALVRWLIGKTKEEQPPVPIVKTQPSQVFSGIRCGDYALVIPESTFKELGHNLIKHGQQYTLGLFNKSNKKTNVSIYIDGSGIGTWRLEAYDSFILERSAKDSGRFTFYAAGTEDGNIAGIDSGNTDLGVVKAVFYPEKIIHKQEPCYRDGSVRDLEVRFSLPAQHGAEGGTGLTGHSEQKFQKAEKIHLDESNLVIIQIKLWCSDKPRPLQ